MPFNPRGHGLPEGFGYEFNEYDSSQGYYDDIYHMFIKGVKFRPLWRQNHIPPVIINYQVIQKDSQDRPQKQQFTPNLNWYYF